MTDTLNSGGNDGGTAVLDDPTYDPGDFKIGDRIRLSENSPFQRYIGAEGKVIRIDKDIVLPIIVWLDVWGKPTGPEGLGRIGLPTCASEIEKVSK